MSPKAERRAARRRMVKDGNERWRYIRRCNRMRRMFAKIWRHPIVRTVLPSMPADPMECRRFLFAGGWLS